MPDNRKSLIYGAFPVCRNYTVRAYLCHAGFTKRRGRETVSSMLGHYDAGFTLRTYTHATRQKQDEAAQTMGSFMAQVM